MRKTLKPGDVVKLPPPKPWQPWRTTPERYTWQWPQESLLPQMPFFTGLARYIGHCLLLDAGMVATVILESALEPVNFERLIADDNNEDYWERVAFADAISLANEGED